MKRRNDTVFTLRSACKRVIIIWLTIGSTGSPIKLATGEPQRYAGNFMQIPKKRYLNA